MKLTHIKEAGCSNVLMWAINNGANIYNDPALCSIINDELHYIITLNDVNFFELFRLTQMYRDKLKIVDEKVAEIPARNVLAELFTGEIESDEENPDKKIPSLEVAEHSIKMFFNLALQMNTDDDIISPGASRMFLPMISRKFNIQIPISFERIIGMCKDNDECSMLFSVNYPGNLNSEIVENESSRIRMMIELNMEKYTSILKWDNTYEKYVNATKYAPLRKAIDHGLYKYNLTSFSKYDNINRTDITCSLFHPNKDVMTKNMKSMKLLKTPLKAAFVIELPIQYMQMIENTFSPEEIDIIYESSMSNIIESGLVYDDFVAPVWDTESDDPEDIEKTTAYNNSISIYNTRIEEVNKTTLASITLLLNKNDGTNDISSAFAMLPSIYKTKAVIVLDSDHYNDYQNHYDPVIVELFGELISMMKKIDQDINNIS